MVRENLNVNVMFEQKPEGDKARLVSEEKKTSRQKEEYCKGPEVGMCSVN